MTYWFFAPVCAVALLGIIWVSIILNTPRKYRRAA